MRILYGVVTLDGGIALLRLRSDMPRRTNDFQALIALIERQLAPNGARVTESKLVFDPVLGDYREVDVAIETAVGGQPFVIGVECVDHARPADILWIDQIAGKYRNLPVDKIIAVSRKGFSKNARRQAGTASIEALTLSEATDADWVRVVDNLKTINVVSFLRPYATAVTIVPASASSSDALRDLSLPAAIAYDRAGRPLGTLSQIADRVLSDPAFLARVEGQAFTDSGTVVEIEYRLPQGAYLLDSAGSKHCIDSIQIEAKCRKEVSSVRLDRKAYRAAQVAVGQGNTLHRPVTFALVEEEGCAATLGWSIRDARRQPSRPRTER